LKGEQSPSTSIITVFWDTNYTQLKISECLIMAGICLIDLTNLAEFSYQLYYEVTDFIVIRQHQGLQFFLTLA